MDNNKRRIPAPAVGGSSLLVIFAALCLTIFALMGLSTVQADSRLADTATQAVSDYYRANRQAHEILSQLRSGAPVEGVTVSGNTCSYQCPISETQALFVTVELDGSSYSITRWQSGSTAEWTPDDTLAVWDGTF